MAGHRQTGGGYMYSCTGTGGWVSLGVKTGNSTKMREETLGSGENLNVVQLPPLPRLWLAIR
jgi:hypothetical protein